MGKGSRRPCHLCSVHYHRHSIAYDLEPATSLSPCCHRQTPTTNQRNKCALSVIFFITFQIDERLTETSSPLSNSSTTILLPAAPYFLSPKISSTAAHASSLLLATTTPFPAAKPLALTTSASYDALQQQQHVYFQANESEQTQFHEQQD